MDSATGFLRNVNATGSVSQLVSLTSSRLLMESCNLTTAAGGLLSASFSAIGAVRTFFSSGGSRSGFSGSVVLQDSTLAASLCQLTDNIGSAILATSSGLVLSSSSFVNNESPLGGAAIRASTGSLRLNRVALERNRGLGLSGGALSLTDVAVVSLEDSYVVSNSAAFGGALSLTRCPDVRLNNNAFFSNTATATGGAVSASSSSIFVEDCAFTDNEAREGGGALHLTLSRLTLDGHRQMAFQQNRAPNGGGGAIFAKVLY